MKTKQNSLKMLCITAVGIALYVALSLCLQVPVFENYYLCLGYAAMVVYCYCFGTVSGTLVGVFGCIACCQITNGLRGMPGWALGNLAIGLILGLTFRWTGKMKNAGVRYFIWVMVSVAASAIAMLLVKSGVECLLYAQPMAVRMGKNSYAFVADAFMLAVSLPLGPRLKKTADQILEK